MKTIATLTATAMLLLAPSPTPVAKSHTPHTHASAPSTTVPQPLVPAAIMAQWETVAHCEQGSHTIGDSSWSVIGSTWSGGLSISNHNWLAYGGTEYASNPGLATPEEQVLIAQRIQTAGGYDGYVPDQNGRCANW